MYYYENIDTGELLTYKEMREQWKNDYDGDDPTNCMSWQDQYIRIPVSDLEYA